MNLFMLLAYFNFMISIFVMYSSDRKSAFQIMLEFLKEMELYDSCQKTLVADQNCNFYPDGWEVVKVPRINGKFCWADMWNAGVGTAINDIVLYLDSDRLLKSDFLKIVMDKIVPKTFVFTSNHYMLLKECDFAFCKELLYSIGDVDFFSRFAGTIEFEPKYTVPNHNYGKNVMSGCVAFHKEDYWKSGGVDRWYCGHGAFADTDYHNQVHQMGYNFLNIEVPELHYFHHKKSGDKNLSKLDIYKLSIDNFIYYCDKWRIPLSKAASMAHQAGAKKPLSYVKKRLSFLKESS